MWKELLIDEPRESEDGDDIPLEIEGWGENPEKACLNNELQKILGGRYPDTGPKIADNFHQQYVICQA